MNISNSDAWWIVQHVLPLYFLPFVAGSIIWSAVKGDFVVRRQFSLGNFFCAILRGLAIPTIWTAVGAVVATIFWLIQEPNYHNQHEIEYWQPSSWIVIFASLTIFIQALVALVVAIAIVELTGFALWRFVLKSMGRGIS